jgi:hypothetical protein
MNHKLLSVKLNNGGVSFGIIQWLNQHVRNKALLYIKSLCFYSGSKL